MSSVSQLTRAMRAAFGDGAVPSSYARAALVGASLLASSAAFAAAPEVTQVTMEELQTDSSGPRLLYLVGSNFSATTTVTIGGLSAKVLPESSSASVLTVELPMLPLGDHEVAITNTTIAKKGPNGTVEETYRFMWTHAVLEGLPGPQGPVGPEGPEGPQGPAGLQGEQGDKGDKGDTGPMGPQGAKGDTGATGPVGPIGPIGPQGIQGEKGEQGDVGPQGPQGDQGMKGDTGEQGIQGPPGQGSGIHAMVASDGSLIMTRSNGVSDFDRSAKGSYVLTFTRDVSACAWLTGAAGGGSASASPVADQGMQVAVTTTASNNKVEDIGFTIIVSCPPGN